MDGRRMSRGERRGGTTPPYNESNVAVLEKKSWAREQTQLVAEPEGAPSSSFTLFFHRWNFRRSRSSSRSSSSRRRRRRKVYTRKVVASLQREESGTVGRHKRRRRGEGEEDSILRKSARYITKEEGDGNSQSHGERKNLDEERRKARWC